MPARVGVQSMRRGPGFAPPEGMRAHRDLLPGTQPISKNAIRLIVPYWSGGTWVFDDPDVGLVREPFVSGVPEILNELVQSIPSARNGFRLLFSDSPFPGYQAEFEQTRSEYGGTWYRQANFGARTAREGWLCPALFKYYEVAPLKIYIRAEPLNPG